MQARQSFITHKRKNRQRSNSITQCFTVQATDHQMDNQTKYDTLVIYSEGVNSVTMECENYHYVGSRM